MATIAGGSPDPLGTLRAGLGLATADTVVELEGLCAAARLDVTAVGMALETVLHALESLPFLVLEHVTISGQGPRDLHAAARWPGGRIADLSDAYPG